MATILWFRRDLRLSDNLALLAAIDRGPVIPVFIQAPEEEAPWQPGGASRWWLHQSLRALDAQLRAAGSRLIIRKGPTVDALRLLAAETGATAILANRLYDEKDKLATLTFPGNLLFEPWTIEPRRVFTAFWKACLRATPPGEPLPAPRRIPAPLEWPSSLRLEDLHLEPTIDWAAGLRQTWQPGEAGAEAHLRRFNVEAYAIERDRPDHPGTSRLSPHLHFGEVSPRQVWKLGHEPFQRQLMWREFAHHLLYHYPQTPLEPLRPEFARFPWCMNARHFKAWTEGRTGYPLVDAGMRELWHTGWMHNRVRMVAASFLVKHLLIPWQEGARWFWDTLVDADLANNTLGWQWAAGSGADAAPYFRIFNPTLQAAKFDPHGAYIRRWAPEQIKPIVDHHAARARALEAFSECKPSRLPASASAPRRPNRPATRTETDLLF
ncbi:MAG TPA: deoxyribodipyrimidine photo-lyase [Bryobacteraceae bacterium]|nr:deoxyribodipyrimidine photo-lyase [Bryobacteraceae bacterium]